MVFVCLLFEFLADCFCHRFLTFVKRNAVCFCLLVRSSRLPRISERLHEADG